MRKLIRQPLIHFLLIGMLFFLLFRIVGGGEEDSRTITVDKDALMNYFQYRSKAFNASVFEERMAAMSEKELKELIDEYVRQEVLYREAMAMGLDKEDYIIRLRMIQKVEFISQGIAEAVTQLSEEEVKRYYEENLEKYYVQPLVTFTHVFFDFERWGSKAEGMAKEELVYLNENKVPFSQSMIRGDRFYYHTNYVERNPEHIARHFGPILAKGVFEAEANDDQWIGPFQSEYGHHLVMVSKNEPGRYPEFREIADRVTEDAQQAYTQKQNDATIQNIIDGYEVRVVYGRND